MIFCPACAVKHGKPNYATMTGDQWKALNITVSELQPSPNSIRWVLIVFRAKCRGCEAQIVTEQRAHQDAEGTWRIDRLAQ